MEERNRPIFSQEEYDKWDPIGKASLIEYLNRTYSNLGLHAIENSDDHDRYGVDVHLVDDKGNIISTWDTQVLGRWGDLEDTISFTEVHVPVRNFSHSKGKIILRSSTGGIWWKDVNDMPNYYVSQRHDAKKGLIFKRADILRSDYRGRKCCISKFSGGKMDTLFHVPRDKGQLVDLRLV